jgi:hypothetical protein
LRLGCIEEKLIELYCQDDEDPARDHISFQFPFDSERFINQCLQSPDNPSSAPSDSPPSASKLGSAQLDRLHQEENLVAHAKVILKEYCKKRECLERAVKVRLMDVVEFLSRERENQDLPRVFPRAYEKHCKDMRDVHHIQQQGREYLRYKDDFITTDPEATYHHFEWLLHSSAEGFMKVSDDLVGHGYVCLIVALLTHFSASNRRS